MIDRRIFRAGSLSLVLAFASAACASPAATNPSAGSSNAGATGAPACGKALTAEDMEGGFLDDHLVAPATGTVVEAALATGSGGPQLTGRTILFVGTFNGPAPVTVPGGALIAVEAATPLVDAESCGGSVRIAAFADVLGGAGKGDAFAEADLGGITVGGASIFCTALSEGSGTVAVECPEIGIRIGSQASTGTLWLRFRSAGEPTTAASMPAWVDRLIGAEPPAETTGPEPSIDGSVSIDGLSVPLLSLGDDFDGVVIEPSVGGRTIAYRATFSFADGDYYSQLSIRIPDYDGPGVHATGTFVEVSRPVSTNGGLPRTVVYSKSDCRVEIGEGELRGSTSCTLTARDPETGTVEVQADWTVATVRYSVGPSVLVRWRLEGAYVSEGQATVLTSINTQLDPSILRVAEVLVGHPGTTDLMRIDIRGFTGDGTYTGEAASASLQDVLSDSPNLRINFAPSSAGPIRPEDRQAWTPATGECTATVSDGGRSGEIHCPGYPIEDSPINGSVILFATWEPA